MKRGHWLKDGAEYWVHYQGRTYKVVPGERVERSSAPASQKSTGNGGLLKSPMPGTVLSVECKEGESVEAGRLLCTLEAMKMEYQIKAPFDGKVKAIFAKDGAQVALGDKLIEVVV